ncbi:hypothetical protein CWI38_0008p0110 [Hamiltosporidium tvaerminnensis]|uniref:Uncharacterized protein n=1 Tax=Hamiltosporidium tvaerminnensis TaxID=1176355 RepID=A0A4Q9M4K6_9MICR|nr:hypothetical protein CWI38_0008p0110 [Hamiltosporidium tvaerminnensis]
MENEIFISESIKNFEFWPNANDCYSIFSKLIGMMIDLQEIYFYKTNFIKLNRFVNQIFYITELILLDINKMIDSLQHLAKNEKFDFEATSKDEENLKLSSSPLNNLFRSYEMWAIKKLIIRDFSIDNLDVKAFSNLLKLKEIKVYRINFQNISFSEFFCAKQEYKIKIMTLDGLNISEKDLIFIANLKKIEDIRL